MTTPTNQTPVVVIAHIDNAGGAGQNGQGSVLVDALPTPPLPISCANATNYLHLVSNYINWLMVAGISTTVWFQGVPTVFPTAQLRDSNGQSAVLAFLTTKFIALAVTGDYSTLTNGDIPTVRVSVTAKATDLATVPTFAVASFLQQRFLGSEYNPTYTLVDEMDVGFAVCLSSPKPNLLCVQDINLDGTIDGTEFATPLTFQLTTLPGSQVGDQWTIGVHGVDTNGHVTVDTTATGVVTQLDLTNGFVATPVNDVLAGSAQTLSVRGFYSRQVTNSALAQAVWDVTLTNVLPAPVILYPQDRNPQDGNISPSEFGQPTAVRIVIPDHVVAGDTWQMQNNVSQGASGTVTVQQVNAGVIDTIVSISPNVIVPTIVPPVYPVNPTTIVPLAAPIFVFPQDNGDKGLILWQEHTRNQLVINLELPLGAKRGALYNLISAYGNVDGRVSFFDVLLGYVHIVMQAPTGSLLTFTAAFTQQNVVGATGTGEITIQPTPQ